MTDYAIVQVTRALAPAVGLVGVGAIAVSLTVIFRSSLGKRSAKRLREDVSEIGERLGRIERALGTSGAEEAGRRAYTDVTEADIRPALRDESAEIRRRLEALETIVVDEEIAER